MLFSVPIDGRFTSSPMAIQAFAGFSSQTNIGLDVGDDSDYRQEIAAPVHVESGASDWTVSVAPINLYVWGAEENKRFKELAREEAIRDLTPDENAELELLTRLRRSEVHPRSADEILWTRRQEKLTLGLVRALQAYVDFHEPSSRS